MKYGEKPKRGKRKSFGRGAWALPHSESPNPMHRQRPVLPSRDLLERGPFYIQGMYASDLEWRCYRMLKRLGWTDREIQFQTDVLGGRMPGGQVLDFVVWSAGQPVIIPVNGDYWHARNLRTLEIDRQKEQFLKEAWRMKFKYLPLYTADLETDEIAYRILQREVGKR